MSASRGRFLTFEGIEGVGKTTQVKQLAAMLAARNIQHIITREPGGTPLAEKIRALVLDNGDERLPGVAELLLMFAARAIHLDNLIEPQLRAGRWVLCDRFTDATFAYQGGGRGVPLADITRLETLVQGGRRPDLTLLLDLPVESGLRRARMRNPHADPDRFEQQRADFFERVRAVYRARAAAEPDRIAVIDADLPVEAVAARIRNELEARSWIT